MKKILLIFIVIITVNSYAQWNTYYTESGQHFDCSFINPNTGWTGGDGTKVFKTTNSGNNWTLIYSPSTSNIIYSIHFADSVHGWAGTYLGEILKTTNGGYNWTATTVAFNKKIYSMYFLNSSTGWFLGEAGVYGKTTNGGANWYNPGSFLGTNDGFSVYFRDSLYGYACGFGKLGRTTNGGSTWNVTTYPDVRLSAISFINSLTGYALGSLQNSTLYAAGLYVLKTTNGGENWENIYSETPYANNILMVTESHFHNESSGLISGINIIAGPSYSYSGLMRKTINGGLNWTGVSHYFGSGLESIEFVNQLTGFATGGNGIYKTTNGGLTLISGVSEKVLDTYSLGQNYPNPFNPKTVISFQLPVDSKVLIKVHDVLGREVETLVNERLQAGTYSTQWDASAYPSGVYFCRMVVRHSGSSTGDFSEARRMMFIK